MVLTSLGHITVHQPLIQAEVLQTNSMAADIFTKASTNEEKWLDVWKVIGHVEPSTLWKSQNSAPSPKDGSGSPMNDKPKNLGKPGDAAAAQVFNRRLVEFCCGEDSKLS